MKVFRLKLLLVCTIVLLVGTGSVALGDWDTGDGHKMHYPQLPDLSDNGMDVLAGPFSVDAEGTVYYEKFLADDFLCTESGPITGIHIWCSYRGDIKYMDPPEFSLVIYDNIQADAGGLPYSRPGQPLWDTYVQPTVELVYATDLDEDFYDPNPDMIVGDDTMLWQYNFEFDAVDAFPQERDQIYWLGVHHTFDLSGDGMVNIMDLLILKQYWPGSLGWKTSGVEQYEDDAVWTDVDTWGAAHPHVVPSGEIWSPLDYPVGHLYEDVSIDLAFVITGPEPVELDFGDAPRPYPTLLAVDGARHIIGGPYFCEVGGLDSPDPEGDGQPHLNALGDDLDGNDDEDGVQIPLLTAGMPANIALMVCGSAPGGGAMVEIWIDWHSDGSWDASDMAFAGALGDGPALVPVLPPANSVNGPTFARCRISTAGGLSPTGQADDGEVEDHKVYIEGGVKRPVPHLKWSQPPIPMDPNEDFPTYCGWDEPSYREWVETTEPFWFDCWDCRTQCYGDADCDGDVDADDEAITMAATGSVWPFPIPPYDECADFDHDTTVGPLDLIILNQNMDTEPDPNCPLRPESSQMVADDFRCLGTMPIESIHWWGSHVGWEDPDMMPPMLPIGWRLGFWSNNASTQRCDFLYGAATGTISGNLPSSLYKIDPTTGIATLIGPIGFNGVTGLSFAPDGTLYGTCHDVVTDQALLITIDRTTGAGTLVGPVGTIGTGQRRVPDISFRSNGVLYGYGDGPDQLITINTATGRGTLVGPTGYTAGGNGMDFAPNGTLYATPYDWQSLVIINPATGAGSDVAGTVGNVPYRINALEFCQQHGVLHGSWKDMSQNSWLVTLDLNTGLPLTTVQTVMGLDALAFNEYSQPKELLKVIEVDEDRVTVDQVGWDYYYGWYPSDICYQYYVDLEPNEVFWQHKYLDRTEDEIFWLSITAIYDPFLTWVDYPWGWKTRPWSWMDDAVRFWLDGAPEPGLVLDPEADVFIEPIEDPEFGESFDVSFELDTDPNYIKWEQPFTDIRLWPHFWDEWSMGWEDHWIEEKWRQDPNPIGWDVAFEDLDGNLVELADDWQCDETGPIDDIHFWTSYESDWWNPNPINQITVRIYTDDPCDPAIPGDYSEPNELKWERTFRIGEFIETWYDSGDQGFFEPVSGEYDLSNHQEYFLVDIDDINDPFIQEQGNIYWLSIEVNSVDYWVGWKTSTGQQIDKAVYKDPSTGEWRELYDPETGAWLDLSFVLTTKESELDIGRLVADDWPCDYNTPITAAVWWGSYIGYGYEACGTSWMSLPVKPDYFLLNIWDDVPVCASGDCCFEHPTPGCVDPVCEASVCSYDPLCCDPMWGWDATCEAEARSDPNCSCDNDLLYSHPNDIIWKYKAYDYDEVLVGYDKFPHGADVDDPNEPVFRYSVRLPREDWFFQDTNDGIYWFSVVAVYDQHIPNYDWGWTNHKHVYNDDAVEGYYDPPGGWFWYDLYDQTGASEDMSFILFTDPDPTICTCWELFHCPGQPVGDATCNGSVNIMDVLKVKQSWGKSFGQVGFNQCADFDHNCSVNIMDILKVKQNWGASGLGGDNTTTPPATCP